MIVAPRHAKEWQAMAGFLMSHAMVQPSPDLAMIGWVDNDELKIVVGFSAFLGKTCQIHVAFTPDWKFSPRKMLQEAFRYVFITRGCDMVIGIVNSNNEKAMRYDTHLGFREIFRLRKMHDDGGDIVVFGMNKAECRYLIEEPKLEGEDAAVHVGHA